MKRDCEDLRAEASEKKRRGDGLSMEVGRWGTDGQRRLCRECGEADSISSLPNV